MPPAPLAQRIARYVARPDRDSFDELAMAAFCDLYGADPSFRGRCDKVGAHPGELARWQAIPLTEVAATPAAQAEPEAGTELRQAAAEHSFRAACLAGLDAPPVLALISEALAPGSSPIERWGGDGSLAADRAGRLDVGAARSWLAARQRDRRPAVIVATAQALEGLLGALERQDLRFQLAWGSRMVVAQEGLEPLVDLVSAGLPSRAAERLALASDRFLGQLRWRGVPTPLYGRPSREGGLEDAVPPPWLRIRAVDPGTLDELPDGRSGVLAVLDLTIRGRPFHLLTASRGAVKHGAVRVAGEAAGRQDPISF